MRISISLLSLHRNRRAALATGHLLNVGDIGPFVSHRKAIQETPHMLQGGSSSGIFTPLVSWCINTSYVVSFDETLYARDRALWAATKNPDFFAVGVESKKTMHPLKVDEGLFHFLEHQFLCIERPWMGLPAQKRYYGQLSGVAKVTRDPRFTRIEEEDILQFRNIVEENGVILNKDDLEIANMDWMGKYKGNSKVLLRPCNTQQVSNILKYCNSKHIAVVPQGGNTGLVGGSVPVFDEVILNLGAMNKIISFDEVSGILVCEAGCILENLDNFLASKGYMMPLDLGAKGSCQIGGNVSTNAGGLRLARYGSLHGNVLGIEVVLSSGSVLDMLGTLRKDNTGYDLKQLFIGGEGTLGVITKVSILTPPKLSSVNLAFLCCESYANCQKIFVEAKKTLGEILSAFEFLDRSALEMVLKHLDGTRDPLPNSKQEFYLLIETTGSNQSHDREKLDTFLELCIEEALVSDGTVAQDNSQVSAFWHLREGVAEALQKEGAVYKYDLSIPLKHLYDLVEEMRSKLGDTAVVVGYGHMGDGNLHLNISAPKYDDKLLAQIEPFVYEWTASHRGSVSAEHGIGFMKSNALHYSKDPQVVELMAEFKRLLDCNGIMNPYKVLPPSYSQLPTSTLALNQIPIE